MKILLTMIEISVRFVSEGAIDGLCDGQLLNSVPFY